MEDLDLELFKLNCKLEKLESQLFIARDAISNILNHNCEEISIKWLEGIYEEIKEEE